MAYHKTLLYLGAIFIIFDMGINFPKYSISIFGILLVLIGYFKWKIYSFFMKIIWFCIFIEVIYDIGRLGYYYMRKMSINYKKNRLENEEKEDEESEDEDEEATNLLAII